MLRVDLADTRVHSTMSEPRSRNWLKISCIGCVGLPCLGLMLAFGFVKCQIGKEGDKLGPELAKLRAMGVPTEPHELQPNPPVPDADNAAPIYKKIAELKASTEKRANRQQIRIMTEYGGHPDDKGIYESALALYKPVFDLIDQLPTKSRIDFKRNYEEGFELMFPEYAEIRAVSRLSGSRTRYWLSRKNYDRALHDLEIQYAISNQLIEEYTLIGGLVCIANYAVAHASLDRLLYAIQDDQAMLAKVEQMLVRRQILPSVRRAFYGELVLGRVGIQKIRSIGEISTGFGDGSNGLESALDRATLGDPAVRTMFEARAVTMWRELFENFPKDEQDWQGFKKALQDMDHKIQNDHSVQNFVNQIMLPVFDDSANAYAKTAASHRIELLAVKLLRRRHQGLPKDLTAFGILGVDPITGNPMRYETKGKGFKVWSVGADLVDNGGVKMGKGVSLNSSDIVLGYGIGLPAPETLRTTLPALPAGSPTVK